MHSRTSTRPQIADRLALFPDSARIQNDTLFLAGLDLTTLAGQYGTPLYLYDQLTLDAAVVEYQSALQKYYPAASRITYAGICLLCKTLAEWTQEHRLFVDCTGVGEIAIAVAGNVPPENILVHGVNKSMDDLNAALEHATTIVLDHLGALTHLQLPLPHYQNQSPIPTLCLPVFPRLPVHPHPAHPQTAQQDSKSGMTREEIWQAAQ